MFEALFGPMHTLVLFFFLVVGGVGFVILRQLWKSRDALRKVTYDD